MIENNEEKILKEIEYVLSHNSENKSFLMNGSWGIGKTYFFKNEVKQLIEKKGYIVVEISLLGIKDIFSLKDKILIEYFSKTNKSIVSDFFRTSYRKIISAFDFKKIIKNIRDVKECMKSVKENFGADLLSKHAFDIIFSNPNEKIFFCFDDCERIADNIFLKEFFSILNSFNHSKNIAFLAIGNMTKIQNENEFNLYKEKIFFRRFLFNKNELKIADILLDKYKNSFIPHDKIKDVIVKIAKERDNNLFQMEEKERQVYDKSKDLYSNMRVLSDIIYIINRAFKCLKEGEYILSEYGIDSIISSFFFFGILFNSSDVIRDFCFYSNNVSHLYGGTEKKYLYSEILSIHISDFFKKLKCAYDYFNEGYFDENKFLEEISVYQESELSRFLERNLEDIKGNVFYLSFIADNDRLRNLREKLSKEISENSKEISFEMINSIITIFVISDIFLNDFHVNDDKTNIIKYLSKDSINSLEDSVSYYYSIKSCVYVNIFKDHYKSYVNYFINALKEEDEKMYIETKKSIFSGNDSKKVISFIVEEISRNGNLNKDDLNDVTKFIMRKIEENNIFSDFSDFIELCKKVPSERKLIEMLDAFQENTPQGIRKEFFEWLIYIISNR